MHGERRYLQAVVCKRQRRTAQLHMHATRSACPIVDMLQNDRCHSHAYSRYSGNHDTSRRKCATLVRWSRPPERPHGACRRTGEFPCDPFLHELECGCAVRCGFHRMDPAVGRQFSDAGRVRKLIWRMRKRRVAHIHRTRNISRHTHLLRICCVPALVPLLDLYASIRRYRSRRSGNSNPDSYRSHPHPLSHRHCYCDPLSFPDPLCLHQVVHDLQSLHCQWSRPMLDQRQLHDLIQYRRCGQHRIHSHPQGIPVQRSDGGFRCGLLECSG